MRLGSIAAALVLATQAACGARPEPEMSSLVGLWRPFDPSGEFPVACQGATMEFRADRTVSIRSGAQQVTAIYRAESRADGLLLVQDSLRTNGEPNCQGIPADYVVHNYFRRAFIELKGDTLRMYPTEQRTGAVFTLVRSQ